MGEKALTKLQGAHRAKSKHRAHEEQDAEPVLASSEIQLQFPIYGAEDEPHGDGRPVMSGHQEEVAHKVLERPVR